MNWTFFLGILSATPKCVIVPVTGHFLVTEGLADCMNEVGVF